VLAAADFFTVHVWTARGLTRFAVLFVIDLSTRRVDVAGIAAAPDAAWMSQINRNLTDVHDGCLRRKRYLIHDRDPLFTVTFRETLAAAGVDVVRLPPRSPNLNAYASASCDQSRKPAWTARCSWAKHLCAEPWPSSLSTIIASATTRASAIS
jgi:hypothetical protein